MSKGVTKQSEDFPKWYTDVVTKAELADYSPVKGSMVIRPYGFALWENMKAALDNMFKETGHVNAYFPLFIPKSFLSKEAEHVDGFAKECAVVTHHRLRATADGKGVEADPDAKLEEELIVRPTSETIIWSMYKKWINSYRDLPILINQWANVVRWEMRTRLFLRTTEFLWQEGHTAHATAEEAEEETLKMLEVYRKFAEEFMAIPVLTGPKTESEKFAGAETTYCIEAMMGDKKALQSGTSHNLGQNFAKAFDVTFQNENNEQDLVWATSWGVSTRLVGAVIMAHGDDKGLILPPKIAPYPVVIIPIFRDDTKDAVMKHTEKITESLKSAGVIFHLDLREKMSPGWKFNEWEMKGAPLRMEIGPRDAENNAVVLARRDTGEKITQNIGKIGEFTANLLNEIQNAMLEKAKIFRDDNTFDIADYDEFKQRNESDGGFYRAGWCGSEECESKVQEETKATIRVIPFDENPSGKTCLLCGKKAKHEVVFSKAY